MAILRSEDEESPSSLNFEVGDKVELYKQQWQRFSLTAPNLKEMPACFAGSQTMNLPLW